MLRLVALLVCLLALPVAAQPSSGQTSTSSGRIAGRVVSAGTVVPLSGVRVLLADSPRETTTDHDGQFALDQLAPVTR